jgi:hypothetical protein
MNPLVLLFDNCAFLRLANAKQSTNNKKESLFSSSIINYAIGNLKEKRKMYTILK